MPPDRDAAFREAFEELVEDLADALNVHVDPDDWYEPTQMQKDAVASAKAALFNLYAARPAERQGVECVVAATGRETIDGALTTIRVAPVEGSALPVVQLGDRVRVSRVEGK